MKAPAIAASLLAVAVLASERVERCPLSCLCETRTWFSPSSVCAEAFTVDCKDLGLLVPPIWFPSQTRVLLLQQHCKGGNTLEHLENVTEINLSQNNTFSVADVCFGWLPVLLSLHLEENLVKELAES